MRRLVSLTVLAIALAVPAVGYAVVGAGSDDGTLSVKGGVGRVYLNLTGTVVGRLGEGYIKVTDPNPNDGQGVQFSGCELTIDKTTSTTICHNTDGVARFKAIGGNYRITMYTAYKASGIFLSAVGHGFTVLNGAGEDPSIPGTFDGTYSINDGPYKSLPNDPHTFPVEAPAGG
jgi:hypothetical protein